MTDDLPPMLSLIQTLCRLHLQHQWELYQELRGKAQRGAIRTQFTKLNDKPQLYLWLYDKAACCRYCLLCYTPQIPHCVQTQTFQRTVSYWYCPNVTVHKPQVKICNILQMTFTFCCLCTAVHFFIVFFSKWSIIFNVYVQLCTCLLKTVPKTQTLY